MKTLTAEVNEAYYIYEYLARLSRSMQTRARNLEELGMSDAAVTMGYLAARIVELRQFASKEIKDGVKDHPIVKNCGVFGMGPITLVSLLYHIDPEKCPTVASLWRYAGLGISDNGQSDRIRSVTKPGSVTWSHNLSTVVSGLRRALIHPRCQYREYYLQEKARFAALGHNGKWSHRRALRQTTRLFLKHFWIVARITYGLPIGEPHDNDNYANPADYGWSI